MPAVRRVTKQISYATVFFFILIMIFVLFIFPSLDLLNRFRPVPPPERADIVIESIDPVIHRGRLDVVARVRNPNPRAGVPDFDLTFVFLDEAGNVLSRITKDSYLMPGAVQYEALLDVEATSALHEVRVDPPEQVNFEELPPFVGVPAFNTFLQGRQIRSIGGQNIEEQKGIINNTSALGYRRVELTGVAFNSNNQVIGVSTTFVGELLVAEQREFTLQWPAPPTPSERVIVIPTTNIYETDNILDIRGNPALLR